ncbi:hypothetical protein F5Y06DRAFT_282673 [Hypoxylon sp. FL0890]|nr:hypothetical protein F5Y06DRAFT_282673 [Hypoxylon sp. FL0890]
MLHSVFVIRSPVHQIIQSYLRICTGRMPFRGLISRLKSTRESRNREENNHKEENCEDENLENLLPSSQQAEPTAQDSTRHLEVNGAESVKGLRKASVSRRRSLNREIPTRSTDPEPSDYLYFGEGTLAANVSQSLLNRSRSKSAGDTPGLPATGSWSHPSHPSHPPSGGGRDQSGFLNTGLNTQTTQMGYSNLTYGGSLQFDYAGTQS